MSGYCHNAASDVVGEFMFSSFYDHHPAVLSSMPLLNLLFFLIMLDIHRHGPRDINGPRLSDGHTSGIQPQTLRESLGMREFRLFTTSQLMIYRDHKSESRSYVHRNSLVYSSRPSPIFVYVTLKIERFLVMLIMQFC
jgi:hypothetical protein